MLRSHSMIFLIVTSIYCQAIIGQEVNYPFECIVRRGAKTFLGIKSTVSCLADEILVSCGIDGTDHSQGTFIDPEHQNTCIATSIRHTDGSSIAVANCCKFPINSINSVSTILSPWTNFEAEATTKCPLNSVATGCQVNHTSGAINDISVSGLYDIDGDDSDTAHCIARAKSSSSYIIGGSQCIETTPDYQLDCHESNTNGECPVGYQLIGCNAQTLDAVTLDSWYIRSNAAGCYIQQDVNAIGICCQLKYKIEPSTTNINDATRSVGDKLRFGLILNEVSDRGDVYITTLYWNYKMYQCELNTINGDYGHGLYLCDSDNYVRCSHDLYNYAIHIDATNGDKSKISGLYIEEIYSDSGEINKFYLDSDGLKLHSVSGTNFVWKINGGTDFSEPITATDAAICRPFMSIKVAACDDWQHESVSNALQIQLKGSNFPSQFFYVNQIDSLPVNGNNKTYEYSQEFSHSLSSSIGELQSVVLAVADDFGYCVKGIEITLSETVYEFNSNDYFGSGVILSSKCDHSYRYLSNDLPLIPCKDNYLELFTYQTRGIYSLDLHSCIAEGSDMTAGNMKDNVFMTIMGKKTNGNNEYQTTDFQFLDHFKPGIVTIDTLGHLIAGNVIIGSSEANAIYSLEVESTLIGIKLESVDYIHSPFNGAEAVTIKINGDELTTINILNKKVLTDGRDRKSVV